MIDILWEIKKLAYAFEKLLPENYEDRNATFDDYQKLTITTYYKLNKIVSFGEKQKNDARIKFR